MGQAPRLRAGWLSHRKRCRREYNPNDDGGLHLKAGTAARRDAPGGLGRLGRNLKRRAATSSAGLVDTARVPCRATGCSAAASSVRNTFSCNPPRHASPRTCPGRGAATRRALREKAMGLAGVNGTSAPSPRLQWGGPWSTAYQADGANDTEHRKPTAPHDTGLRLTPPAAARAAGASP